MSSTMNKVDMSLDDIIKLNKKSKTGMSPLVRTQTSHNKNNNKNQKRPTANKKIPRAGRSTGTNSHVAGNITKTNNAALQKKRINALKKLREAKQALALIDNKFIKPQINTQNQPQQRNRPRINRNYGNNVTQPTQNQPQQRNRPRINRNYGNNVTQPTNKALKTKAQKKQRYRNRKMVAANQSFTNNNTKRQNIQRNFGSQSSLNNRNNFSGSNMSLASLGSQRKNVQNNSYSPAYSQLSSPNRSPQKRQRHQNQWNSDDIDDNLTVSITNNRKQPQRRNKKNKPFNIHSLSVQTDKHRDYEFDPNVFSSIGTSVPLNERFSQTGQRKYRINNSGSRQVFY